MGPARQLSSTSVRASGPPTTRTRCGPTCSATTSTLRRSATSLEASTRVTTSRRMIPTGFAKRHRSSACSRTSARSRVANQSTRTTSANSSARPRNTSSPASEAMTSTAIICRVRSSIVCCGWCGTTGIRISTPRANCETPSCACTTRDNGRARCCLRSPPSSTAASLMSSRCGQRLTTTCAAFSIT